MKSIAVSAVLLASSCLALPSKRDANDTGLLPINATQPMNWTSTPMARNIGPNDTMPAHHHNATHGHCLPFNLTILGEDHHYNCTDDGHHRNETMPFNSTGDHEHCPPLNLTMLGYHHHSNCTYGHHRNMSMPLNSTMPFNTTGPSGDNGLYDLGAAAPFNLTEISGMTEMMGMRAIRDLNDTNSDDPILPLNSTGSDNSTTGVPMSAFVLGSRQLDGSVPATPLNVTDMSNSTMTAPPNTTDTSNSTTPTDQGFSEFANLGYADMGLEMRDSNNTGSGLILPNMTMPSGVGSGSS